MVRLVVAALALLVAACGGAPPAGPTRAPWEGMTRLRAAVPAELLQHCEEATYSETFPAEAGEVAGLDCDLPAGEAVDYATYKLFDSTASMKAFFDTISSGVTSGGNAEGAGCGAAEPGPGPAAWTHGRALCYVFITDDAQIQWTHEDLNIRGSAFRDDGDFEPLIEWWKSVIPTD